MIRARPHSSLSPLCLSFWPAFCLALVLASPALARQQSQPTPGTVHDDKAVNPKVLGVDVTFLANEGFLLKSGRYKILIDSFLREPTDIYAGLPSELHKDLANAKPPFDGLTIVLVSHNHLDHVQMRSLEKYLEHNPQAQLMTSPDVLRALKESARDFETIQRRLTPIPTVQGTMNKILQEEMSIEFFQLRHGGKANGEVLNLAHLITLGGVKLLHVGDAEPTLENFSRYSLAKRGIDVVFLPYWFFGSPEGVQVIREEIKPRVVVACHVPPTEWDKVSELMKTQFPGVILFKEPLEQRNFQPVASAPGDTGTKASGD
jgi:L-ascorbate metabolism protein UlaG (beta-lactamase superfamily)